MVEQWSPKPRAEGSSPSAPAKSLKPVFRENTEIQDFFLLRQNSFNCNFAVVCEEITVVFHTFSHEIHTKKRWYNVTTSQLPSAMLHKEVSPIKTNKQAMKRSGVQSLKSTSLFFL